MQRRVFGWFCVVWLVLVGALVGLRRHKSLKRLALVGLVGLVGRLAQSGSEDGKREINVIIKVRYVFSSNPYIYFQKDIK